MNLKQTILTIFLKTFLKPHPDTRIKLMNAYFSIVVRARGATRDFRLHEKISHWAPTPHKGSANHAHLL